MHPSKYMYMTEIRTRLSAPLVIHASRLWNNISASHLEDSIRNSLCFMRIKPWLRFTSTCVPLVRHQRETLHFVPSWYDSVRNSLCFALLTSRNNSTIVGGRVLGEDNASSVRIYQVLGITRCPHGVSSSKIDKNVIQSSHTGLIAQT